MTRGEGFEAQTIPARRELLYVFWPRYTSGRVRKGLVPSTMAER